MSFITSKDSQTSAKQGTNLKIRKLQFIQIATQKRKETDREAQESTPGQNNIRHMNERARANNSCANSKHKISTKTDIKSTVLKAWHT